jgi:hypothetical protein
VRGGASFYEAHQSAAVKHAQKESFKEKRRTRKGAPIRFRRGRPRSDFEQDDDEGEDDQRLDERETENHRRLNTSAGARIARLAFACEAGSHSRSESIDADADMSRIGITAPQSTYSVGQTVRGWFPLGNRENRESPPKPPRG